MKWKNVYGMLSSDKCEDMSTQAKIYFNKIPEKRIRERKNTVTLSP